MIGWAGIYNSIVRNNTAGRAGGAMVGAGFFGSGYLVDSVVTGNTAGVVLGFNGDGTNISADPLFVDPANGDYRLGLGSPGGGRCLAAGPRRAPHKGRVASGVMPVKDLCGQCALTARHLAAPHTPTDRHALPAAPP